MFIRLNFDTFYRDLQSDFSFEGARALFDYLEMLEDATRETIEYDPIDLKCSYTEHNSLEECLEQYDFADSLQELENYTTVIDSENSDVVVIQNF